MIKKILYTLALFTCSLTLNAQSYWSYDDHGLSLKMPEISLISVMPSNYTVNLALGLPKSAGDKPGENVDSKDDNTWLNYSCSMKYRGSYRKVYAQISSGSVPDGLAIDLEVKNLQTQGSGNYGKRYTNSVRLSNQPQVVVHRIGGGCTNRGRSFGHQLIYELKLVDIDELIVDDDKTYLTITYTISD